MPRYRVHSPLLHNGQRIDPGQVTDLPLDAHTVLLLACGAISQDDAAGADQAKSDPTPAKPAKPGKTPAKPAKPA